MHGGIKFYRGSAAAARSYVEADRSRADDYYLAEGTGLADRYVASSLTTADEGTSVISAAGSLDGEAYERWVAGYDPDTGSARGRLRHDARGLRFVEVVVNGPKTWSLAAAVDRDVAAAYDEALERAAVEVISWLAHHATTRIGPRGRQAQVPVEEMEAAVVRHYTSRAGDPHRHLHVQINARVFAKGTWRGLHSVGVVDSIEAINGIGHAAVMCDPVFRAVLAARGYSLDEKGEIRQLAPFAGRFSQRAAQIARHVDRYEAAWRSENPSQEPGPRLQQAWDRRAWADARPDKVVPKSGADIVATWNDELQSLGFTAPVGPVAFPNSQAGHLDRDAVASLIVTRLGARRSAWNAADIRGEAERVIASTGVVADGRTRRETVEDITERARTQCLMLVERDDVPDHIRCLTSARVLAVENRLLDMIAERGSRSVAEPAPPDGPQHLDDVQRGVVAALAGRSALLVIEGAAGTGKTATLAAAQAELADRHRRLVVVTPTLKAAQAAREQVGADAFSAAWIIHQHGYRWDEDGRWSRVESSAGAAARLLPGDVLLIDEAGMLDQDTALALFEIADASGVTVALLGDRHQLPAVGRGGVLDLASRWVPPEAHHELESVHRFSDQRYAELSLLMRSGERSGEVFDALLQRGEIVVHATEVERTSALGVIGARGDQLVIADTRDQVASLNAEIRDRRHPRGDEIGERGGETVARSGERIAPGDRVATRRNDRELGVANRDQWTVLTTHADGSLVVVGRAGPRVLPAAYVHEHVELAFSTTAYGAQGETVDIAHVALGEASGGASAYVGMTRGRHQNTAHLVVADDDEARSQWIEIFGRDRADLGPRNAGQRALDDLDRYGPMAPDVALQAMALRSPSPRPTGVTVPGSYGKAPARPNDTRGVPPGRSR